MARPSTPAQPAHAPRGARKVPRRAAHCTSRPPASARFQEQSRRRRVCRADPGLVRAVQPEHGPARIALPGRHSVQSQRSVGKIEHRRNPRDISRERGILTERAARVGVPAQGDAIIGAVQHGSTAGTRRQRIVPVSPCRHLHGPRSETPADGCNTLDEFAGARRQQDAPRAHPMPCGKVLAQYVIVGVGVGGRIDPGQRPHSLRAGSRGIDVGGEIPARAPPGVRAAVHALGKFAHHRLHAQASTAATMPSQAVRVAMRRACALCRGPGDAACAFKA